jgi:hypothetical protein
MKSRVVLATSAVLGIAAVGGGIYWVATRKPGGPSLTPAQSSGASALPKSTTTATSRSATSVATTAPTTAATAPTSSAGPGTLQSGQSLVSGQSIQSPSGRGMLTMQPDGNLVLYDTQAQPRRALWASGTSVSGATATMQADGNLVVYDGSHKPLWASGTDGHPGATLRLQDDGNLVVYAGSSPVWSSNTVNWTAPPAQSGGFNLFKTVSDVGKFASSASSTASNAASTASNAASSASNAASNAASSAVDTASGLLSGSIQRGGRSVSGWSLGVAS